MKIQSISPTRISLFGGSTDLPIYADTYGGIVISLSINLYQKITMYSGEDLFETKDHIFPYNADPHFYYKILDRFKLNDGIHLTRLACEFDGLIESGLGSSASAAVALIGAINKRLNLNLSLEDIAEEAWKLETQKVGLYGGKQDQYAAAFGGVNVFEFKKDKVDITPLVRGFIDPVLPSLVLFYTGETRKSATIQEGLKELSKDQVSTLNQIKQLAVEAIEPIAKGDIARVGYLLDQAWLLKRKSNKGVSNPHIDDIYRKALEHGALGGKILGSGGGGYMLFIVYPDQRKDFIKKMGLEQWDFDVDWNGLQVRELPA